MGARLLSAPDGHCAPRLRAAAGADRAAPGRAARRLAPPRLRRATGTNRAPDVLRAAGSPVRRARRRERHAGRAGAAPASSARRAVPSRSCSSSSSKGSSGKRWRDRRGGCEQASSSGPSSSSSRSETGAGPSGSRASRAARCRFLRTSTSRSRIPERYQTVYAREPGSAAAPTAGLHFTPELLARLDPATVTLHVGLDTFRPVVADRLEEHELHGERYSVEPGGVGADRVGIAGARGGDDDGACPRDGGSGRPARRPYLAVHHAGLRVPARRRAAHELPPSALDASRARDGVRGSRGDARALSGRRSPSGTASTPSATRCSSSDGRTWHGFGTISCPMRERFPNRLVAGGGEGWPHGFSPRGDASPRGRGGFGRLE